ncbi:MAG: multicopper oxidase family protein [Alphaproteobacteria bacterium]|nr:multicopper oxidase family protein [Alphaproteobacteria bacterium]
MLTRRGAIASALAAAGIAGSRAETQKPTVLRIERRSIEVDGQPASVFALRQPDGQSGLVALSGKPFRVRLENRIDEPSLVHWHGLLPPWQQDGVPGLSGSPIAPGDAADYDFPLRFGGTFWMHSELGLQRQRLLSAPLIVHDAQDRQGEQELVLFLADFSFTPPEQILEQLRGASVPGAKSAPSRTKPRTLVPLPSLVPTRSDPAMAAMKSEIRYDAFLANDRTLADPEVVSTEPGGKLLLRVINGAAMSNFHLDLGRLRGELTAVDGSPIVPVRGRRFPVAVAQRLDVRLALPRGSGAYPIFAVLEGERRRTGIVLAAGGARVGRIAQTEAFASTPLTLDFERRLRAAQPLPTRKPDRVHTILLTGATDPYPWSIDGVAWNPSSPPMEVAEGERVELVMTNETRLSQPMHLHGHRFQVVEIDAERVSGAVRDTVLVAPGRRVRVAFEANNPGEWAFHCTLLYHRASGTFATIRYV